MKPKPARIRAMIQQIDQIIVSAKGLEAQFSEAIALTHPHFTESARNLIHYRALRQHDLRSLQKQLGRLGMSRLANSAPHVMASLETCRAILSGMVHKSKITISHTELSIRQAQKSMKTHSAALLGQGTEGRRSRIMLTLPSEAAEGQELLGHLLENGMDCARINCAHDGPEAWQAMIHGLQQQAEGLERPCKVAMDLAGPKIRTGALAVGPKVRKFRPVRNELGQVIQPARYWLAPAPHPDGLYQHLPIPTDRMDDLAQSSKLNFRDARGKMRSIKIREVSAGGVLGECKKTAYLLTGMPLFPEQFKLSLPILVGELPSIEQELLLTEGSLLLLRREQLAGKPVAYQPDGQLIHPSFISCTAPEIFDSVKIGEPISFDDGKIQGVIEEISKAGLLVRIGQTKSSGVSLKADKGINFPESELRLAGLTQKDRQDLEFVATHADIVNFSFVNSPQDVSDLREALAQYERPEPLGIILKIETQSGFNHLTEILLTGMQSYPLGVMIARGDLAVEAGWENMARIQEEILSLCRAAHVPDIWATQVLENLAKKGIPSRAEITDAGMAQRAECVMLNKGPEIVQALCLLDLILKQGRAYMEKNLPMLPKLETAKQA